MLKFYVIIFCFFTTAQLSAQAVSINTTGTTADPSAILDITSTTKGILIPRMLKAARNAIAAPVAGLLVYQSAPDSLGFHYYNGTKWIWLIGSGNVDTSKWAYNGTHIYNKNTGNVGIKTGTQIPNSTLQVKGTFAIDTSMGINGTGMLGGSLSVPFSLANANSYIGLAPTGSGNDYYELPDPTTCPGRIYYVRNNNNPTLNYAYLRSAGDKQMCNGNGGCLPKPSDSPTACYYTLTTGNPNPNPKTIMCISDGINWTVGQIN